MNVRVRSGPSFKGPLKIGSVRMLLFNYAFACRHGGSLVLRNEDTDRKRLLPSMVRDLYSALEWLGIDYQEGGEKGGGYGPYTQSERLPLYREYAERLIAKGYGYRCFCPDEHLMTERETQRCQGRYGGYDRRCLALEPAEVSRRIGERQPHVVRLKCPDRPHPVTFDDEVFGSTTVDLSTLDDQILLKSDDFPTYHLSSVVDDHLMKITHVIRSNVWLRNTAKHLFLYECFGWEPPRFAHVPPILRSGSLKPVNEYRRLGFVPPALNNFATMMGWRPKGNGEVWGLDTLLKEFSLEGLKRKEAQADEARLRWLNRQHIKRATDEELEAWADSFLDAQGDAARRPPLNADGLRMLRPRLRTLRDLLDYAYVFEDPAPLELAASLPLPAHDAARLAGLFEAGLQRIEPFDSRHVEGAARELAQGQGVEPETVGGVLRLFITGSTASPELFAVMAALGRTTCRRRLVNGLRALENAAGGPSTNPSGEYYKTQEENNDGN